MSILLTIVAAIAAFAIGYAAGRTRRVDVATPAVMPAKPSPAIDALPADLPREVARIPAVAPIAAAVPIPAAATPAPPSLDDGTIAERARLVRSFEAETAMLRHALTSGRASVVQLEAFADERRRLFDDLAMAHGETARYRQLVIDLENDAPPPFFGVGAPDDLKLIVGVGPVLERMLQMLGVATYRQIARWTERDIDEIDAKLREFPGRIRRDAWVTQARALHQSKYGEALPSRERG